MCFFECRKRVEKASFFSFSFSGRDGWCRVQKMGGEGTKLKERRQIEGGV